MGICVLLLLAFVFGNAAAADETVTCHFLSGYKKIYIIDLPDHMRQQNVREPLFCECTTDGQTECIGAITGFKPVLGDKDYILNKINTDISYQKIYSDNDMMLLFTCDSKKEEVAEKCKEALRSEPEHIRKAVCDLQKIKDKCP